MQDAPPAALAAQIRSRLPADGLFAGQDWRIAPAPFPLDAALIRELESLGRVLLQFYRAVNLLYRRSVEGRQPAWVAELLDQGKPAGLIGWQRHAGLRQELPRVIRPDCLLTEGGFAMSELDSVPGGIGLTHWLNATYAELAPGAGVIGGRDGMLQGFGGIFGSAPAVHIVVSEESATYRPEMNWLAAGLRALGRNVQVRPPDFTGAAPGDAVYRFFELFDLANVPGAPALFDRAAAKEIRVTPPPRPIFEEKLLFGLLWNRNLREFWRQELGDGFFQRLLRHVPRTWVVDPTPLPPHAGIPGLELTDWRQLKSLSQRDRDLILKISGFSDRAWGSRGVHLGSDLATEDWSAAVDQAMAGWPASPWLLQRYEKPRVVNSPWFDPATGHWAMMEGRVRLCPYYFVQGDGDAARASLGGVLATICPADKKIIHGMRDAILAPCGPAPAAG